MCQTIIEIQAARPHYNHANNFLPHLMSQSISSKPEPKKSQSNWSYQAYFLAQRQHQASIAEDSSTSSVNDMTHLHADDDEKHCNQVIAKMEELAASIDVRLTIIR